jgi:TDG/mug DNA glycosylase family protein
MVRGGLPDYIRPGLDVLLVGINPGLRSAELGHHFAGANNRFWDLLHDSGMTPRRLTYEEDARLPELGIGLTNIAARPTGTSSELGRGDFSKGRQALAEKIARYTPAWVVFVGITVYRGFKPELARVELRCGVQKDSLEGARVFVVPNPSGRNAHYIYEEMLRYWKELAGLVGRSAYATPASDASFGGRFSPMVS